MLFEMRTKVRKGLPQWRCKENIERRYADACAKQHLPADLYQVGISQDGNRISMNFPQSITGLPGMSTDSGKTSS